MPTISWGTKIIILFSSFVMLIITMVVMSMNQKINLVSDDYYQRELVYQDRIDEMNNANALAEKVEHSIGAKAVNIQFPELFKNKAVKGEIIFFRPSDKSKDYTTAIQLNKGAQLIPLEKLSKGMYKLKINWTAEATSYLTEEIIVIP